MASINDILEKNCKIKSNEKGKCPHCNGELVTYDGIEIGEGDTVYYPCTCDECGAGFKGYYSLEFISHDNVYV